MDRNINVRMFKVERRTDCRVGLSTCLQRIFAMPIVEREHEIEPELHLRLEKFALRAGIVTGEMIRRQTSDLPPEAASGVEVRPLGVSSIGHSSAFAYHPESGSLAWQVARNSITPVRFMIYAQRFLGSAGYDVFPVLNADVWALLQQGRVRSVRIKVGNPQELEAVDAAAQTVASGFQALKQALNPAFVDVTFSMGHEQRDISRMSVLRYFRWMNREVEAGRGDVSAVSAGIAPDEGGKAETINLLGSQMGRSLRLNIPADDPSESFRLRSEFARSVLRDSLPAIVDQS